MVISICIMQISKWIMVFLIWIREISTLIMGISEIMDISEWIMLRFGSLFTIFGPLAIVQYLWSIVYYPWSIVYRPWSLVSCSWAIVYYHWSIAHCPWSIVYYTNVPYTFRACADALIEGSGNV